MECSKCCVALLFLLGFCRVDGIPLARFYTFGRTAGDASLRPNDDGSSPAISLNVSFPFFDMLHSTVYVRLLLYTYENHRSIGYGNYMRKHVGKHALLNFAAVLMWMVHSFEATY